MKRISLILIIAVCLVGCSKGKGLTQEQLGLQEGRASASERSGQTVNKEDGSKGMGYAFLYREVTIPMNADAAPIIEALGEPVDYFEAASCAFQGLDKIYYYQGFELGTYPNEDKDYVSYVNLLDDTVETDQGISLGASLSEVKAAYGEDYSVEGNAYIYRQEDTKLTFFIEEDEVIQITYAAIVEGINN
jgi:hypothetical protein